MPKEAQSFTARPAEASRSFPAYLPNPTGLVHAAFAPSSQALHCPEVVIATLSLAVEWLLQAPQEVRQGAMLRATELLLAVPLASRRQQLGSSSSSGGWGRSGGGAGAVAGGAAGQEGGPGTPLTSPAVRPAAAQQRLPTPLQLPSSPALSSVTSPVGGPLSPALQQRPLSPSMAALQAAAAAASGTSAAQQAQQAQQQRPTTPRASSFDRLQGAGDPSAADIAAAAAGMAAAAAGGGGSTAEQLEAAAAAAAEAKATQLWSFLNGHAMVPQVG